MDGDLFKPTLKTEGYRETRTYHISKLFYVAFFGGTIPTTVLGARNASWLGVKKGYIQLFYAAGILILLTKAVVVALYAGDMISLTSRDIRLGVRIADVLLYLLMYMVMKPKFYQHSLNGGDTEPLFKEALKWIGIGIVIEFALMTIGGAIGVSIFK